VRRVYTLDQLRAFVAVAEELNFSRAAERLHMTQPPLSRQVQRLEREVGIELLTRTSRSVVLTPAGATFLLEARRVIALAEAAPLRARRVASGSVGRVAIGFTAVSALTVLGSWVRLLHEHSSGVDIVLSEMVTTAQTEAILANELDVGLVRGAPSSAVLQSRLVHVEPLVAAVPLDHPLARLERRPRLEDLAEFDIVTYDPDSSRYFHELVVAVFHSAGLAPNYSQYLTQVSSQLVLVEAGLGISLVPSSASRLRPERIAFLEIEDIAADAVELHACWRFDHGNPALDVALDLLASVFAEHESPRPTAASQ
jgi:DNA-binding transcriptional LysR family regulator